MGNLSDIVGVVAGMKNPMTTDGDLIIGGGDGNPARLAKGTDGQVLTLASGNPAWAAASGGSLLVAETVVSGSAVTSVTFSGLDGNVAGGYMLEIVMVNADTNPIDISLFVNGDTSNGNYYAQYITANGTATSGQNSNTAKIANASGSDGTFCVCNINVFGGYFSALSNNVYNQATNMYVVTWAMRKISTITNITSLIVTSSTASSIGVGSTFRLYKRK